MRRELNSTNSMGIDQDSNPQHFACNAQTLTITSCCYPWLWERVRQSSFIHNCHKFSVHRCDNCKTLCRVAIFYWKNVSLWLHDFLNLIELTVVNGNSENFQDLDNRESLRLAMFTEDHQRAVFGYALHQFHYTTNSIKSEYFWSFWFLKWPRLVVVCYHNVIMILDLHPILLWCHEIWYNSERVHMLWSTLHLFPHH